jgi:hypothetical protein
MMSDNDRAIDSDALREVKDAALQQSSAPESEQVIVRVNLKLPKEFAREMQNAMMRSRYFLAVSYSNSDGTRLYHRYCRKNFSIEDALIATREVEVGLLDERDDLEQKN